MTFGFGTTIRDQVLEVIVRQAIAGAPWREICVGPMLVNNIAPEEVEAEVYRRLHKGKNALPPEDRQSLETYLAEWQHVVDTRNLKPIADIEEVVASFYLQFDSAKPSIVICKSPAMMYLHLMLLTWDKKQAIDIDHAVSRLSQEQSEKFKNNLLESTKELASKTENFKNRPAARLPWKDRFANLRDQAWSEMEENLSADLNTYFKWGFRSETGATLRRLGVLYDFSLTSAVSVADDAPVMPTRDSATILREVERRGIAGGEMQPLVDLQSPGGVLRFHSTAFWDMDGLLAPGFVLEHLHAGYLFSDSVRERLATWLTLYRAAPLYAFFENICLVLDYPRSVFLDEHFRPGNDSGPAITFADDYQNFAMHGMNVPRSLVENRERLTLEEIDKATNIELRRLMIELYGHSRYMMDSGAELINEDEFGQLFRKEIPNDEAIVMLCVINSTMEPDGTYKKYFLRVPPSVRTAREAVAWTFSLQPNDYNPNVQS